MSFVTRRFYLSVTIHSRNLFFKRHRFRFLTRRVLGVLFSNLAIQFATGRSSGGVVNVPRVLGPSVSLIRFVSEKWIRPIFLVLLGHIGRFLPDVFVLNLLRFYTRPPGFPKVPFMLGIRYPSITSVRLANVLFRMLVRLIRVSVDRCQTGSTALQYSTMYSVGYPVFSMTDFRGFPR